MRAQAEIFIMVGIVILGVVVILFAFNAVRETSTTVPGAIANKQLLVKSSIEDFISTSFDTILKDLLQKGGFSQVQAGALQFQSQKLNYWIKDGNLTIPNLEQNLAREYETFLKTNKHRILSLYSGQISVQEPITIVTLFENKVTITVDMPVRIEGYDIPGQFTATAPTNIKHLFGIAQDFITLQHQERYYEHFITTSILASDLPTLILLTECNSSYYNDSQSLRPRLDVLIHTALNNVHFLPEEVNESLPELEFLFPFQGESLELLYPPLSLMEFSLEPDPITATAEELSSGICLSEPVTVSYTIRYPIILQLKDTLSQNQLQLAFEVYINNSSPG